MHYLDIVQFSDDAAQEALTDMPPRSEEVSLLLQNYGQ